MEAAPAIGGTGYELAVPVILVVIMICMGMEHRGRRAAFTISVEVELQNGALATPIVVSLLAELIVFPGT